MLLETRKDGTKFTNRALKESAERLQNLSGQYDDMQKQLVEQVITLSWFCTQHVSLVLIYLAQHCRYTSCSAANCHECSESLACSASFSCVLSYCGGF